MSESPKKVAVIGCGMVGVMTARYLQRAGHSVTLVDPREPGEGASFGNAGCFNPSSVVPIAGPDTFKQVPGYLADPLGPLSIRWRYALPILPWLIRYGLAGTPGRIAAQADALHALLAPSLEALMPVVADAGAQHLVRRDGILIVYRTARSVESDARNWAIRRAHGIEWEDLDAAALHDFDPNLSLDVKFGKYVPGNGHTVNPGALVKAIAASVQAAGGVLLRAVARDFRFAGNRLEAVVTDAGEVAAEVAVIAAGAHSKPLAAAAGDRVPLETERGYHVVIGDPAVQPRVPTTDSEAKMVATPMEMGVRVAGTVELAGLELPPDWRRADILRKRIGGLYPALAESAAHGDVTRWMGHRPSLPDSLPVLGRSRRSPDVIHAFGHQHVGMTAAPFTAVVVAELVSGRPSPIDLAPYRPSRF